MYKKVKIKPTQIRVNKAIEGETIEMKMRRVLANNEPIKEGAPLIYTERKEGVKSGYNIRTDRFDVALEAMTVVHKSTIAKRDYVPKAKETPEDKKEVGGDQKNTKEVGGDQKNTSE